MRHSVFSRRRLLQAGTLSATGLVLPEFLRLAQAAEPGKSSTADAVLFLNLAGGPAHLDTLDMKENLPQETRSEFSSISSNVAGLHVCEHLPKLAGMLDEFALIRGISHTTGDHPQGQAYIATGNRPSPALKYPSYGSIVTKELSGDPRLATLCGDSANGMVGRFHGRCVCSFQNQCRPQTRRAIRCTRNLTCNGSEHRENQSARATSGRSEQSAQDERTGQSTARCARHVQRAGLQHDYFAQDTTGIQRQQ